jgi:predicted enzyme related to lactoylglutathione lyase
MSERDGYQNGVPCWVDLMTNDVDAAHSFYAGLFGWEIADQGEEYGNYGLATLRGRTVAGIGPIQDPGMPPAWTTYLATTNADTTAAKVKDAGGTVLMAPMDVGETGRMALAQDPAGAVVGFWQAKEHIGAELVNEPGTLCWNELHVRDTQAADEFYRAVCGYELEKLDGPPGFDYKMLNVDGRPAGGRMHMGQDFPAEVPAQWLCYFAVEDTDAAVEKIKAAGGSLTVGPNDSAYGRMAICADPAGATFAIIKLAEET